MDEEAFCTRWQVKIKWRNRQHCEWSRQQHVLLYVIKWQMIHFQALWKTKSFVKVCLKFKLPLWMKGLLIHLSPLWQLPLWHFPWWHNFPVYRAHCTRALIQINGDPKSQNPDCIYMINHRSRFASVCCFWRCNANAVQLLPRIKARRYLQTSVTCAYVHLHANYCFQIYSTCSYL